jgi:hypothetical protein
MPLSDDEKKILLASMGVGESGVDSLPQSYFLGVCPFKTNGVPMPLKGLVKAGPGMPSGDIQGIQAVCLPMPCLGCYCPLWIDYDHFRDLAPGYLSASDSQKGLCAIKFAALALIANLKI